MIALIGSREIPCAVDLIWDTSKNNNIPFAECYMNGKTSQYGMLATQSDIKTGSGKPSIAACCAELFYDAIVMTIANKDDNKDVQEYWMCAISQGAILPETDKIYKGLDNLYNAVNKIMTVFETPSFKQLCDTPFEFENYNISRYDLFPDEFKDYQYVRSHGLSKFMKKVVGVTVLILLISSSAGYYIYDKNLKETAAQAASDAEAESQRQMIKERNLKLTTRTAYHAIMISRQMGKVPEFIKGWLLNNVVWSAESGDIVTADYRRIDGTINGIKKYIHTEMNIADNGIIFETENSNIITIKIPLVNLSPSLNQDMLLFNDIVDDVMSLFQLINTSYNINTTSIFNGGSEFGAAITWGSQTSDVEFVIKKMDMYGSTFTELLLTAQSNKWNIKGEIYALP